MVFVLLTDIFCHSLLVGVLRRRLNIDLALRMSIRGLDLLGGIPFRRFV